MNSPTPLISPILVCAVFLGANLLGGCMHGDPAETPHTGDTIDVVDTVPRPPADTIRGFSLVDPYADAVYMVDHAFIGWKCTSTVRKAPYRVHGDTTFGTILLHELCGLTMGPTHYQDTLESTKDFAVAGGRVLTPGADSAWREVPWGPYRFYPHLERDLWHPFEWLPSDSLLRVEFLGEVRWVFARKYQPAGTIPTPVSYLYVQGLGLVLANSRYKETVHGNDNGEIIRMVRYKEHDEEEIQAAIERILDLVPPIRVGSGGETER